MAARHLKVHESPSIVKTAEYLCDHAIQVDQATIGSTHLALHLTDHHCGIDINAYIKRSAMNGDECTPVFNIFEQVCLVVCHPIAMDVNQISCEKSVEFT